ncbi:GNAT family N-acetyltransferase [Secundilactobacillus collinoides]|nr:GNAT family N-acetyltransferase [Secundilactobacillus collinoides]
MPGQTVELNAQETAVDFYKRLGFKRVGDAFLEVGIVHYRMVKN